MTRAARTLAAVVLALAGTHADVRAGEIDLVATPPSAEMRLEQIRERVQAAVVYPQTARERGIQGVARIQFRVDPAGRAADVVTVESSGSQLLDKAAQSAALNARGLPQLFGWVRIPVRFELARR